MILHGNGTDVWKSAARLLGYSVIGALGILAVSAHAAPGSLDPAFGGSGAVLTDAAGGSWDYGTAVVIQADGKIVAASRAYPVHGVEAGANVLRYHPDGSLDTAFGNAGRVAFSYMQTAAMTVSLAIQPDGFILVGGSSYVTDTTNGSTSLAFTVVRLRPDGRLDDSFGNGGRVDTAIIPGGTSELAAIAVQPDGKIVAAGTADPWYSWQMFAAVRYRPDGTLDESFGQGGMATTKVGPLWERVYALALQPDGKILVGGESYTDIPSGMDFAMVRYQPNGTLDGSFGANGKVTTNFTGGEYLYNSNIIASLALLPDGRIVAAGTAYQDIGSYDFALARYLPDGALDLGFGSGGKVVTDVGWYSDFASELVIQPDGKIIVAGTVYANADDIGLVRYHPDGRLDRTFGVDGKVWTDLLGGSEDGAGAIALQADGRIVVVGHGGFRSAQDPSDVAVLRYLNPAPIPVDIDIKPDTDKNAVKAGSGGRIAVAILGRDGFDATTVEPQTVTVGGVVASKKGNGQTVYGTGDVNDDGWMDFIVHVETEALSLHIGNNTVFVDGRTTAGTPFYGSDFIQMNP